MLLEAKVTNQGQVTIPIAIRRRFNISNGGTIAFNQQGDQVFIEVPKRHRAIEERFENYDVETNQSELQTFMKEVDTGSLQGEEM